MLENEIDPSIQRWLVAAHGYGDTNFDGPRLGEQLQLSPDAAMKILDSLVKSNLVERLSTGLFQLTPDGRQLASRLSEGD